MFNESLNINHNENAITDVYCVQKWSIWSRASSDETSLKKIIEVPQMTFAHKLKLSYRHCLLVNDIN